MVCSDPRDYELVQFQLYLFLLFHLFHLFHLFPLYRCVSSCIKIRVRDLRKLNCPRYGRLNQENLSWRQEDGTDRVGLLSEKGGQESAPKTCPKPLPCLNMLICSALLSFIR